MRIAFDGHVIHRQVDGVSRYTFHLIEALASTVLTQDELFVLHEAQVGSDLLRIEELAHHPNVMLRTTAGLGSATGQVALANALRAINADLYHSPYRLFSMLTSVPTIVTIHELAMLSDRDGRRWTGRLSQFSQRTQLRVTRRANAVICVSQHLREEFLAAVEMPPDHVHVVYNGVDHSRFHPRYRPEARQRAARLLGIEPPYILALASSEPRKNISTLIHAYAKLPADDVPRLVLAGAAGWGKGPLYDLVREAGIADRVRFTGYVPEAVLPDLYAGARCFVFPSLYEGFGLPVLEAMACSAPVVASNRSAIPEVAGDGALLVDGGNVVALAEGIYRVVSDKAFRDGLRGKATAQAATFSWERCARETRRIYESVLAD
ncbi:MAG: glycosyltransferase family 4 protein [Ardenticatenales bacterium]|nr:glycosyltransferase family 4 protein [Ardenticatenales bacterium]MCB9171423.1 glycosyltransferase family 4 protein [Ardenticatenales bacterium]